MDESCGNFSDWMPCQATRCRKCRSQNVKYREWDSSCGGHTDYNYKCLGCGYSWWVDGIDS